MKRIPIKIISTILVLLFLIVTVYFFSHKSFKIVKKISVQDAEYAISKHYLNIEELVEYNLDNDTVYSIIEVPAINDSTISLMVKNNCEFHVFQSNKLIFHIEKRTHYKGKSTKTKKYYTIKNKSRDNKSCYTLKLKTKKPIFVLIKTNKNYELNDLIELTNLEEKNIDFLKELNLPIIRINNKDSCLTKKSYCSNSIEIFQNENYFKTSAKMKLRGNTSISFPKKQFNLKFPNELKIKNINLKKSVLLSSFNDKSFIRNVLAKDLYSEFRNKTKSSEYIHLIINDFYEGLYILLKHPDQEFKNELVDTSQINFLLQIDRGKKDFKSISDKFGFIIKKSNKEKLEVKDKTLRLEEFIEEKNLSLIDINSFIDYFIISELSKNIDAYRLSTYLSFINGKFSIDIVWDFDQSFGLSKYHKGYESNGFIIESDLNKFIPPFFNNLWNNTYFKRKLINRYKKLRKNILSEKSINIKINSYYEEILLSSNINFERWNILEKEIWPNYNTFKTHKEEIDYVKYWTNKRLKWLDKQWM